jgi:DNA-binding NarL/FixJ family response regulator
MVLRIVIADDHPMFRDALRSAVGGVVPDGIIAEADNFDRVVAELVAVPETDLVLLDLNMPGMQGFSGLIYLCVQFPDVPVAIISANEEPRVMRRAINAGASGYIPKSVRSEDMRAALNTLLTGDVWLPAGVGHDPEKIDEDAASAARFASLTPQQMRVLMMLNDGLVNKQIAYELNVSEGTVKAHVSAILQKLGVMSRTQAVIMVQQLAAEANAPQEAIRRAAHEE